MILFHNLHTLAAKFQQTKTVMTHFVDVKNKQIHSTRSEINLFFSLN